MKNTYYVDHHKWGAHTAGILPLIVVTVVTVVDDDLAFIE